MFTLDGKKIAIIGGTGSLGKALIRRLLAGSLGLPRKILIMSRDEAKQHDLRVEYGCGRSVGGVATEEGLYSNFNRLLEFRIGDARDRSSVRAALLDADVVVFAAALKQVPSCEYFPYEAVQTNIQGAENVVRVIREDRLPVEVVVGISTDKACEPTSAMGATKLLQERVFTAANLLTPHTRFVLVRYGNVLASRGSVVPLFRAQLSAGGPLTVTDPTMTRFFMPLEGAVDTVHHALLHARPGDIIVPKIPSACIMDVARAFARPSGARIEIIGTRPGEKQHEILISAVEAPRARACGADFFRVLPVLPELGIDDGAPHPLTHAYGSDTAPLDLEGVTALLAAHGLLSPAGKEQGETLR